MRAGTSSGVAVQQGRWMTQSPLALAAAGMSLVVKAPAGYQGMRKGHEDQQGLARLPLASSPHQRESRIALGQPHQDVGSQEQQSGHQRMHRTIHPRAEGVSLPPVAEGWTAGKCLQSWKAHPLQRE